jgi:hypothetical protein
MMNLAIWKFPLSCRGAPDSRTPHDGKGFHESRRKDNDENWLTKKSAPVFLGEYLLSSHFIFAYLRISTAPAVSQTRA